MQALQSVWRGGVLMKRFQGKKGMVILLLLICMLVGYYFYLSNRYQEAKENTVETTNVQDVLLRDLERNYPATPKEVVKYYSELTKCFYNEEYTSEELSQLAAKAMELYDAELIANQSEEDYIPQLKSDIAAFKKDEITVSSYKTASSTDVEYFTKDGRECAGLLCTYTLRSGAQLQYLEEQFILRKDEEGHWKILGWEKAETKKQD